MKIVKLFDCNFKWKWLTLNTAYAKTQTIYEAINKLPLAKKYTKELTEEA